MPQAVVLTRERAVGVSKACMAVLFVERSIPVTFSSRPHSACQRESGRQRAPHSLFRIVRCFREA